MQLPFNPIVKNYIRRYVDTRYGTINRVLSLSRYYFPLIEEELIKADLPVELRALPIIESALSTLCSFEQGRLADLQSLAHQHGLPLAHDLRTVLKARMACDSRIVISGSLYFVSEAVRLFQDGEI